MENSKSIELPYDPVTPLYSIQPKEIKPLSLKDICIPMFITAVFTVAKMQKQQVPKYLLTEEWIMKIVDRDKD